MEKIMHDLRLSEIVAPFGVGAITDVSGQSLVAPDTSYWDKRVAQEVHCARLSETLGQARLFEAPTHAERAGKTTKSLEYWRFPAWRFCERCDRMTRFTGKHKGAWINECNHCGGALIPMRYVAVCKGGSHIQDISWPLWTHRGRGSDDPGSSPECSDATSLRFDRDRKAGEGLSALSVRCTACKRSRSLADLVEPGALKRDGMGCWGRQPWQEKSTTTCDFDLVAVPRAATGNYMAEQVSALDIPEELPASLATRDSIRSHHDFGRLTNLPDPSRVEMIASWIASDLGTTSEAVLAVAAEEADSSTPERAITVDLKAGEWAAFEKKMNRGGRDSTQGDFVVDSWPSETASSYEPLTAGHVSGIGQVRRVREVRALRGFRRYSPDAALIDADLGTNHQKDYPAIELFGEGVFLRFDESRLAAWEAREDVRARAEVLFARYRATPWAGRLEAPEPRYVALHTIAHLMIRRLAYDSGYAAASVRERIYANGDGIDRSAGILMYTAAGDAQGTLGGLVRLGAPDKLVPLFVAALGDGDYCSNDPVCREHASGVDSNLNLAACHGCVLISETSCESANRLLDRQLVLGGPKVRGLLQNVLDVTHLASRDHVQE